MAKRSDAEMYFLKMNTIKFNLGSCRHEKIKKNGKFPRRGDSNTNRGYEVRQPREIVTRPPPS